MADQDNSATPLWVKLLAAVASARPVVAVLKKTMPGLDRWLLRRSKGRLAISGILPTLLLTTTGRKSGKPRSAALLYLDHASGWVVIGSNFGGTSHPAWYLNLQANPDATVTVDGAEIPVTARDAGLQEREELWAQAVRLYPGYTTYKTRVGDRQVPIIVLSRK